MVKQVYDKNTKNLDILCECGKPITVSNENGMFCEDRCNEDPTATAAGKLFCAELAKLFER